MTTPSYTNTYTIEDIPMAPARKKQRQEYFIFSDRPTDSIMFPELDGEITPLKMKKFPSIRIRQPNQQMDNHLSSSIDKLSVLEEDLIRNPLILMSKSFDPIRLRQRNKSEKKELERS